MDHAVLIGIQYVILLFALCAHEASHAAMANYCGDPTGRLLNRMSLNPLRHIDPIGTVIFPLIMLAFPGIPLFGWAKPVPFNPRNLGNIRRDPVLIALAGPGANLLMAIGSALVARVFAAALGLFPGMQVLGILAIVFFLLAVVNASLMLFNLIPCPPLDGHYVLHYFLPPAGQRAMESIGPFGILIVLVLVQQTGILHGPMNAVMGVVNLLAFYGTPVQSPF